MNNIVDILDIDNLCCGCGACFNSCPKNAIYIEQNKFGFYIPIVDIKLCNECGICVQNCPVKNFDASKNKNFIDPYRYAYQADKDTLLRSSSGGAFSAIAKEIISQNGIVFGASYNNNFDVEHIEISNINQLDKIRGSKYSQSLQNISYKLVKKYIKQNIKVLYVGTPCQISGLKKFLGNDSDFLYTIDLLCHGVPSPKIFKEYLNTICDTQNIEKISMRGSSTWDVRFEVILKNGLKKSYTGNKSIFINAFHNDLILRKCCYKCLFASIPRQGDLTIGDFWNAKKLKIGAPFENKSSIVLINNEKGYNLWENVIYSDQKKSFKDLGHIDIKNLNQNIYSPNARFNIHIDDFWEKYMKHKFNDAAYLALYGSENVGLVLYASDNYGSCATNFSLYSIIKKIGYNPIILDSLVHIDGISLNYLSKKCILSSRFMPDGDVNYPNIICSSFVLGSDYSLNISDPRTRYYIEYMLLTFAQDSKRIIAYAPSLGVPNLNDDNIKYLFKILLNRFNSLSFRESNSVDFCYNNFNIKSQYVLDPVFLPEKNFFFDIASSSRIDMQKPFLIAYILDPDFDKIEFIYKKEKELNVKCYIILDRSKINKKYDYIDGKHLLKIDEFEDFIYCFVNCKYVITDSFHGACFSIIFNKQFVAFKNRNIHRFDSILLLLNSDKDRLCNSIFNSVKEADTYCDFKFGCNFEKINYIVEKMRIKSINYIESALSNNKLQHKNYDNDIYMQYARLWKNNVALTNKIKLINRNTRNIYKIIAKTADKLPDFLQWSMDFSQNYMQLRFKNLNPKIHYEFTYIDKMQFCLHCEDKTLEKYCDKEFFQVKKIWNIETNSSIKLNKEISQENPEIDILYLLFSSLKYTYKLLEKNELKTYNN